MNINLKACPLVRLTKLGASKPQQAATGIWGEYRLGAINHTSLPIDYTLTGYLVAPVTVGQPVIILRLTRNDVPVLGQFISTEVETLTEIGFATANSIYRLEFLSSPISKHGHPD